MTRISELQVWTVGVLCSAAITVAAGQIEQISSVQSASGGFSEVQRLTAITSSDSIESSVNRNGTLVNFSGFFASPLLQPDLDTDKDGICDELDLDNDNDGIEDLDEITGRLFDPAVSTDPNNSDSDNDGTSDRLELVSGTSPTNRVSVLAITGITASGGAIRVRWSGGTTARQYLLRKTSMMADWDVVFTNEPPTLLNEEVIDTTTNRVVFYTIKVERP